MKKIYFGNREIQKGDVLKRRKSNLKILIHYGMYVGFWNSKHWVIENHYKHGVRLVTYEQFLNGKEIIDVRWFNGNPSLSQREYAVQRAFAFQKKPYRLLGYNCEDFVNEVQLGSRYSYQTNWGVGIATVLVAGFLFLRK